MANRDVSGYYRPTSSASAADDSFLEHLAHRFSVKCSETPIPVSLSSAEDEQAVIEVPESSTPSLPDMQSSIVDLKKLGKYSRFLHRARRFLRAFSRRTPIKTSKVHKSGEGISNNTTEIEENSSYSPAHGPNNGGPRHPALVRRNGVSITDIEDELSREKNESTERFSHIPRYRGNPPWKTRFHPDLIRPPSNKKSKARFDP